MAEFDYIVVGAGSAGCVLAERLSASGRHRVLLLEAGGSDRRLWIQIPLGYGKTFYDPRVNWMYDTEPDPGLGGRCDYWPRGKVLGGSSSINAMVYCRGQAEDYREWEAAGNPGWGWPEALRVFKWLEDNEAGADAWRGSGGPLHVTDTTSELHPLCRHFVEAARQAGLPFNPDFNGARQEGVGFYQITSRDGRRLSSARAFLEPARRRRNLAVETAAQAMRILFEGRRALGVAYRQHGVEREARAAAEVILAAGAVNSPQLLQLSGVGPPELLRAQGIEVLEAHAGVGANLQDHLGLNYTYRSRIATLNAVLGCRRGRLAAGARYLLLRRGPLALSLNQAGGFFRTDPALSRPNMQLYLQAITTLKPKAGERPLLSPDGFHGFSLGLSSLRPLSRGRIEIASADPFARPRIFAAAYSAPEDLAEMLAGVKFLRHLASRPALAAIIEEELLPGGGCVSDEALIEDIRQRSGTVFHPVGTCRMAPRESAGVVDAKLRVHGLEGLRVADASIFPSITSGNSNAPAMMVGARAAELILAEA